MTSGSATSEDAANLTLWRNRSSAHAAALREAIAFRRVCREVAQLRASEAAKTRTVPPRRIGRQALLGAGFLMFAGAAAWAAIDPPLGLWPSIAEVSADYNTGKGEQRTLVLDGGISVQMNTLTSMSDDGGADAPGVDLVAGEIAVTVPANAKRPFSIHARDVTVTSPAGTVNVRADSPEVAITSVDADAMVNIAGRQIVLPAHHQIRIRRGEYQAAHIVDLAPVLAWRQDELLLRNASLAAAVGEINRYRPGRILIENSQLASRRVNAILQLRDISQSLDLICRLTGAHRTVIGDYVILS